MKIAGKKIAVTNDISTNKKNVLIAIEQAANVITSFGFIFLTGNILGFTVKI